MTNIDYSTKRISSQLLEEIKSALQSVNFGSIEIYISDSNVTQITTRTIKKTSTSIEKKEYKKSDPSKKSKKLLLNNLVNYTPDRP
jgi:hypothetical protein